MTSERGFFDLPILGYAAIGLAAALAVAGIALKVQTARLDAVKAEYDGFVSQTKAIGEAAEKAAKLKAEDDRKRKEAADAETAKTRRDLAALYDAYGRLRDQRTRSGYLPPAAPGSASPDRACFDRAAVDRAMAELDRGVSEIARRGDQAIGDLDAARRWARMR